jgi:secondary thiamine-phosphate synthase enzyme
MKKIIPERDDYQHDRVDNNAHAHLRSLLLGNSVTLPVRHGKLKLGTWQAIMFVDFDGPRSHRKVEVTVVPCSKTF